MNRFRIGQRGLVDRDTPISFTFDGRAYQGYRGDTLASALLANGVHLVGRSFKYHRPRGILGAGADEPNALVGVRRDAARYAPNLLATQVELYDGLEAVSQNRSPSLQHDRMGFNDRLSRFLPAGFYYKTFIWPKGAWDKIYEPRIRAAAGLGIAPDLPDPDRYAQRYAHCDVLVVGAGPAGIAAAVAAAATGARVILCDDRARMGGSLLAAAGVKIEGLGPQAWLTETLGRLAEMPNVTLLPRTAAFGYYPHNMLGLAQRLTDHLSDAPSGSVRERLWQVRARQVVIAAGAIERPLVFPDNDRPGIMLAEAARTYLQQYGVAVGRRIVVVTAHDSAYRAAHELVEAGIDVTVADVRRTPEIASRASSALRILTGVTVEGTSGKLRVRAVSIGHGQRIEKIPCDALLMCGGFTPSVHLFSQSRGTLAWDETIQVYLPASSAEAVRTAGAGRARFELADALADGDRAGRDAAAAADRVVAPTELERKVEVSHEIGAGGYVGALPQKRGAAGGKAFVDWQNDVTAKDIKLAVQEGFRSIEHVKRYTTTGMATDQGKLSNINALGIVASASGRTIPQIGLTTFRPPYTPVTFGTLAGAARGDLFDPVRTTPMHEWARDHGAVFENVGQWKRARFFPRDGEDMHAAVARECRSVREAVGIFDASTLGKIEVVGRDAAEFLNRLYVNSWTGLGIGRCRYGVLLREDGFVMDDGVVGRLAADRFHVTTTTGGAARVLSMMEDYLQTEWGDLEVWLTSTTEQWAVIAVPGLRARAVLEPLVEDFDIAVQAFPHMSVADARICGVPMRIMRVSFSGELGFEVNVPSAQAPRVWSAILERGRPYDMTPYGTEAMHVLRAEKGFIIVGQETDGTVTPGDLGLGWTIGRRKPDFVGKRSLARPSMSDADRKQLVGLLTIDRSTLLEEGAQVSETPEGHSIGHVTSSYASAAVGRPIALAMISGGRERLGGKLCVPMPRGSIDVDVVEPVFFDKEGERVHG